MLPPCVSANFRISVKSYERICILVSLLTCDVAFWQLILMVAAQREIYKNKIKWSILKIIVVVGVFADDDDATVTNWTIIVWRAKDTQLMPVRLRSGFGSFFAFCFCCYFHKKLFTQLFWQLSDMWQMVKGLLWNFQFFFSCCWLFHFTFKTKNRVDVVNGILGKKIETKFTQKIQMEKILQTWIFNYETIFFFLFCFIKFHIILCFTFSLEINVIIFWT